MYSTQVRGLSSSFSKVTFLMWILLYFGLNLPRRAQNHMLLKVHSKLELMMFHSHSLVQSRSLCTTDVTIGTQLCLEYNSASLIQFDTSQSVVYGHYVTGSWTMYSLLQTRIKVIFRKVVLFRNWLSHKSCTWLWNCSERERLHLVSEDYATLATIWLISTKRNISDSDIFTSGKTAIVD